MRSPLASNLRGSGFRNLTPFRARGRGNSGQFVPQQLGFLGYFDPHNGGSTTQITDSSGNGLDPTSFAAAGAAPTYLAYTGTPYVWFPGVINGNVISTPHAAAMAITDELEIVARVRGDVLTAGRIMAKATSAAAGSAFDLAFNTSNSFFNQITSDAPANTTLVSAIHAHTTSDTFWLKSTIDANNGTHKVARFFTAADAATEPASYTQLGSDVTSATGIVLNNPTGTGLTLGNRTGNDRTMTGRMYYVALRTPIGGADVATFDAASCTQTGYTTGAGTVWTVTRSTAGKKLVVLSPAAGQARSLVVFGTDDYATAPVAAIPPMDATDAWSVVLVIRQWDTPTSFGRYLSTKTGSGTGKGISIRTNGTTRQIACHFSDGTTGVDSFGPAAAAAGVKQVLVVSCTGPSVTIYVNGANGTPVDLTTVGDRTTGQMEIGRDSGAASNYQDFSLIAYGTVARALTGAEADALSAYFGGGS